MLFTVQNNTRFTTPCSIFPPIALQLRISQSEIILRNCHLACESCWLGVLCRASLIAETTRPRTHLDFSDSLQNRPFVLKRVSIKSHVPTISIIAPLSMMVFQSTSNKGFALRNSKFSKYINCSCILSSDNLNILIWLWKSSCAIFQQLYIIKKSIEVFQHQRMLDLFNENCCRITDCKIQSN